MLRTKQICESFQLVVIGMRAHIVMNFFMRNELVVPQRARGRQTVRTFFHTVDARFWGPAFKVCDNATPIKNLLQKKSSKGLSVSVSTAGSQRACR